MKFCRDGGLFGWIQSPSLRGSGLKSEADGFLWTASRVSLFTREWIEITTPYNPTMLYNVSLFTREWIEIALGLSELIVGNRLPLYEGVD